MKHLISSFLILISPNVFAENPVSPQAYAPICESIATVAGVQNYSSEDLTFCRDTSIFSPATSDQGALNVFFTGRIAKALKPMSCTVAVKYANLGKAPTVLVKNCQSLPVRRALFAVSDSSDSVRCCRINCWTGGYACFMYPPGTSCVWHACH